MNATHNNGHTRTVEEKRALLKRLLEENPVRAYNVSNRDVEQPPAPVASRNDWDDIPVENYVFERSPEYLNLATQMDAAAAIGIEYPFFKVVEPINGAVARVNGRQCINFSGYNYLGMSGDPVVSRAAKDAIERLGTSASASRLVAGQRPIHLELENALADHLGTEDALSFVTGYLTGVTTIGHLFKPGDLIVHDALIHNCTLIGSKLSGARTVAFPHNDADALERILRELRGKHRRVLILAEGIYSMDGDIADLPRMIDLKRRFKAFLMVDEAHSIGVLGRTGRGVTEHFGVDPREVDLLMGTLSKAMGSCGGYIAGNRALIDYLRHTVPGFVYSVGMPPPVAAAALAALRLLRDEPQRIYRLRDLSRLFLLEARARGLNTGSSRDTPIIPVIVGDSRRCGLLAQALYLRGINIQPIIFPAVEDRASRLRVFVTCLHTEREVTSTVDAVVEELKRLGDQSLFRGRKNSESE
ncbi:MAG TPA: aminotransferase class I/II-fold pyridoxal phosphate-dependent enzyme [Isosphaeraceae bacterium]|nr:aminotransferase class I/II-fold pyridoxal phosphate-dependent enzyme [Isosphaeraceae bacterium]